MCLAMSVGALATPSEPGATAVHFLEQIRARKINLEPGGDTALTPQTSEPKRRQIARRLDRMAADLGLDPLEVGPSKLDDDLAAVLVRKIGGFDPSRLQVFPIALIKRGAQWVAAPVPASFENSGVGYAAPLRQRLAALEEWMLREQVLDLDKLREQAADRLRRQISASLPASTLREFNSQQAANRFLTACEQRNLPEIFGLLGGLAATLPNDWPLRLKAAETAVATTADVAPPWRLLIAPEVLRVLVHHEEDGATALVSIACLDPAATTTTHAAPPRIQLVHLELAKSPDGLWRIDLPPNFLPDRTPAVEAASDEPDSDLLDSVPAKLAALYPPTPQPTAQQTQQAVLAALQAPIPAALMRLIHLDGDPQTARQACTRAIQLWWSLRQPAAMGCALPLATQEDGNQAATACQFFSARNPDHVDIQMLYFEQSPDGWHWTPEPRPENTSRFRAWTDLQSPHWQNNWQTALLTECLVLEKIPATAPTVADARKLIESWLQATRTGDVLAALRLTARLNTPDSHTNLLRNLGYEMAGARRSQQASLVTAIHQGAVWTTVGTQAATREQPSYPLYPVLATPAGPRLMLEIDLFAAANRSRDFLNKTALERLQKFSAPAAEDLAKLFATYQTSVVKTATP